MSHFKKCYTRIYSHNLVLEIYKLSKVFPKEETYNLEK